LLHQDRIYKFPQREHLLINPYDPEIANKDQSQGWARELEHDAESVFWLLVYWAAVAQPKDRPREDIGAVVWTHLMGNCEDRENLIGNLSRSTSRKGLTHSVYEPLKALICKLASFLVVDRCWLPATDPRNDPEYLNEAFQRSILQFILDNRRENFMDCAIDSTLRTMEWMPQP
jgi:hypothetical protein